MSHYTSTRHNCNAFSFEFFGHFFNLSNLKQIGLSFLKSNTLQMSDLKKKKCAVLIIAKEISSHKKLVDI